MEETYQVLGMYELDSNVLNNYQLGKEVDSYVGVQPKYEESRLEEGYGNEVLAFTGFLLGGAALFHCFRRGMQKRNRRS